MQFSKKELNSKKKNLDDLIPKTMQASNFAQWRLYSDFIYSEQYHITSEAKFRNHTTQAPQKTPFLEV